MPNARIWNSECHLLCFFVSFFLLSYFALWSWEERVFGPGDEQISGLSSVQWAHYMFEGYPTKSDQVYIDIHYLAADIRTNIHRGHSTCIHVGYPTKSVQVYYDNHYLADIRTQWADISSTLISSVQPAQYMHEVGYPTVGVNLLWYQLHNLKKCTE